MRAVFRPVGGIGDARARTEDGAHIGCERAQMADGRINTGSRADARQRDHLRADDKGIDAACLRGELGIMQDVPAKAPLIRRR